MMEQNEKKKKPNKFLKAIGVCFLGLLFGFFAATAFYGAGILLDIAKESEFLSEKIPILSAQIENEEDIKDTNDLTENLDSTKVEEEDVPEESVIFSNTESLENTAVNMVTTVTDVSEIVKAVMPAIVSIINEYTVIEDYGYFGTYEEKYAASGTGIIVGENDAEIILVTNYHVIEDADRLEITFVDGSTAEAMVKGTDEEMDLAILAIDSASLSEDTKKNIAVAVLGDSDNLEVGEPAIAIGNALGYGQSVTTGVISAVNRQIGLDTGDEIHGTFIQTDAAINPGNSGGALLNMKGEVIGINSSKIGGEAIEGMGYAIPITEAMPILEDLMTKVVRNKVAREDKGYIGILGYSSYDYMYFNGGDVPYGVYVDSVYDDSPAKEAGILEGDIITKFGDYTIETMTDLENALWYYAKGESVVVELKRMDKKGVYKSHVTTLVLGEVQN